jgi:hypothetical protein
MMVDRLKAGLRLWSRFCSKFCSKFCRLVANLSYILHGRAARCRRFRSASSKPSLATATQTQSKQTTPHLQPVGICAQEDADQDR